MAKQKPQEPKRPTPPWEYDYREKVEPRYIYSCFESLQEDEWEDEEEDEDYEPPTQIAPEKPISEVTLGWLLQHLPEGVTPDMVKIDFGYHASSMAYEDHHVRFYYEVTIPARTEEFEKASEQFRREMAKYEKDMEAYKEACRLYEIEQTEAKLAKLKEKKK
jgi:hypothetical protein